MPNLTTARISTLLNSNVNCPCVMVNDVFYQYEFQGKLDGKDYYCQTQNTALMLEDGSVKTDLLALNEDSEGSEIREALENYFATIKYKGSKDVIDRTTTKDIRS